MSFNPAKLALGLLVYTILRICVLDFHFQDVNDGDADHNEDENCDPLKRLLGFDLLVQVVHGVVELINSCV